MADTARDPDDLRARFATDESAARRAGHGAPGGGGTRSRRPAVRPDR